MKIVIKYQIMEKLEQKVDILKIIKEGHIY